MARILVAENDKNFGLILKMELEDEQFPVDLVTNGVEAVLASIGTPYALLLLDMDLPRLNGMDTLRIIKKLNPALPVIAFSGCHGGWEGEESVKTGVMKNLMKPFKISQLKKEIRDYFQNH